MATRQPIPSLMELTFPHVTSEVPFSVLTSTLRFRPRVKASDIQSSIWRRQQVNDLMDKINQVEVARRLGDAVNTYYAQGKSVTVPHYLLSEIVRMGYNDEFFAFDVSTYLEMGLYHKTFSPRMRQLDTNVIVFVVFRGFFYFVVLEQTWKNYLGELMELDSIDFNFDLDAVFLFRTLSGEVVPVVKGLMAVDANTKDPWK